MIGRLLNRSLVQRKSRIAVAIFAVVMGATMVAALLGISWDMEAKFGKEARNFGANIVLLPKGDSLLDYEIGGTDNNNGAVYLKGVNYAALKKDYIIGAAPYLYGLAEVNGTKAVIAGTQFDEASKVSPWWKISGRWINDAQSSVIGAKVAKKLKIKVGDDIRLKTKSSFKRFRVSGILQANGPEDNQVFITLTAAQTLLKLPNSVSFIQISAVTDNKSISEIATELQKTIEGSTAKEVKQIAGAEKNLLIKIRWLMILVTVVVLAASVLSVMSTMTSTVLERRKEIGIMKALGADNGKIARLFYLEAAIIGLSGGLVGYLAGLLLSQAIGQSVFATFISIRLSILPITLATALVVAITASRWPVQQALRIDPIITLRGE